MREKWRKKRMRRLKRKRRQNRKWCNHDLYPICSSLTISLHYTTQLPPPTSTCHFFHLVLSNSININRKDHVVGQLPSRITIWEHGLGSIQVDLGGIEPSSSANWNRVSISGALIMKIVSCLRISAGLMIPGKNSNFWNFSSRHSDII